MIYISVISTVIDFEFGKETVMGSSVYRGINTDLSTGIGIRLECASTLSVVMCVAGKTSR